MLAALAWQNKKKTYRAVIFYLSATRVKTTRTRQRRHAEVQWYGGSHEGEREERETRQVYYETGYWALILLLYRVPPPRRAARPRPLPCSSYPHNV